jgi:serine/threonine-protein kinase
LALAIHASHQRGVVHRDLKPANVLLTPDGTPKIVDFGLAKHLDRESSLTQCGAIVGTPSYMAPEQASGQSREVSPASDVYALGAILYEMLTGRPPFRAATALDTLWQVVHEAVVPPRQLQSQLPRDLETICLKCLEKEPRRRYASALDLAEDLRRLLAGRPIACRPVGPAGQVWRWCRRNPAVAALLAGLACLLLTGTAISSYFGLQADAAAHQAQTALHEAQLAREREQTTARRFVRFMKQHPALIQLSPEQLLAEFLKQNSDLSERDVIDAFVPAPEAGVSVDTVVPNMFGD